MRDSAHIPWENSQLVTASPPQTVRLADPGDAAEIATIFNQGIEERVATFETHPKTAEGVGELISSGALILVAEDGTGVVGFAKAGPYDDSSAYYRGINEATLYVERGARRGGVGRALLEALVVAAGERGLYKLTAKIFSSNQPSIALFRACGFREVGVHRRHGVIDGDWKDVTVVERSLGEG
jgi:L-amino acid N-acyltransferase YncA